MPYPAYVPTRLVSIGGAMGIENSQLLKVKVTIRSNKSLVWEATGYRFERVGYEGVSALGQELVIELPRTDVAGWRDPLLNSIIDIAVPNSFTHRYTAEVSFIDAAGVTRGSSVTIGPFVVPAGVATLDLDKSMPVGSVAGDTVTIPDLWGDLVQQAQDAALAAQAAAEDARNRAVDGFSGASLALKGLRVFLGQTEMFEPIDKYLDLRQEWHGDSTSIADGTPGYALHPMSELASYGWTVNNPPHDPYPQGLRASSYFNYHIGGSVAQEVAGRMLKPGAEYWAGPQADDADGNPTQQVNIQVGGNDNLLGGSTELQQRSYLCGMTAIDSIVRGPTRHTGMAGWTYTGTWGDLNDPLFSNAGKAKATVEVGAKARYRTVALEGGGFTIMLMAGSSANPAEVGGALGSAFYGRVRHYTNGVADAWHAFAGDTTAASASPGMPGHNLHYGVVPVVYGPPQQATTGVPVVTGDEYEFEIEMAPGQGQALIVNSVTPWGTPPYVFLSHVGKYPDSAFAAYAPYTGNNNLADEFFRPSLKNIVANYPHERIKLIDPTLQEARFNLVESGIRAPDGLHPNAFGAILLAWAYLDGVRGRTDLSGLASALSGIQEYLIQLAQKTYVDQQDLILKGMIDGVISDLADTRAEFTAALAGIDNTASIAVTEPRVGILRFTSSTD